MTSGATIESNHLISKSEQVRLAPTYEILRSLAPLVKQYFVNVEEDDNLFKITCQRCNGFVTCKYKSGKLLYVTFLHAVLCTLGLYPG